MWRYQVFIVVSYRSYKIGFPLLIGIKSHFLKSQLYYSICTELQSAGQGLIMCLHHVLYLYDSHFINACGGLCGGLTDEEAIPSHWRLIKGGLNKLSLALWKFWTTHICTVDGVCVCVCVCLCVRERQRVRVRVSIPRVEDIFEIDQYVRNNNPK